ncbi:MAG: cyanophycinase [Chitinophagales bacterium]
MSSPNVNHISIKSNNNCSNVLLTLMLMISIMSCNKAELSVAPISALINEEKSGDATTLIGDNGDVQTITQSGFVLMGGGTDVDEAFKWMIDRSGGGDFVVIRATGTNAYDSYIYGLGTVNSVETIIINSVTKANKANIEKKIKNAEALFIAGGDQYDYVKYWKNTKVEDAINYLINTKHVPVGGTSAGCAILGEVYFSAQFGTITSTQALNNPYNQKVALGKSDFINIPILSQTITDTHFDNPDRRGRSTTFLARMVQDFGMAAKGIACEEKTAVCIDANNIATVFGYNNGTAFFMKPTGLGPEVCVPNTKLTWNRSNQAVKVYKIENEINGNGSFDLNDWSTASGGTWVYFWVDNGVFHEN